MLESVTRRRDAPDEEPVFCLGEGELEFMPFPVWYEEFAMVGKACLYLGVFPELVYGDECLSECGHAANVA